MTIFGPVPSRRLGMSLGINNIPYKICSYSCLYCQVGKAIKMQVHRQPFYPIDDIFRQVASALKHLRGSEKYPDYLTLVPDGEPTLDENMGDLIEKLKQFNIPVAVISNASLMNHPDVQEELMQADYVSLKVDAVSEHTWKKINKPHSDLKLDNILSGIDSFSRKFKGKLTTETMLLQNKNDQVQEIEDIALFINTFQPDVSYLAIPTRPPAFKEAKAVNESKLLEAFVIYRNYIESVELLTGYEGNTFASTGDLRKDILSISAVHPLREEAVQSLQEQLQDHLGIVQELIDEQLIKRLEFDGHTYYVRRYPKKHD